MPVLIVENLNKSFRLYEHPSDRLKEVLFGGTRHVVHHVLKDINLQLKAGESLGIIGQNGAGKSTLLKILVGILLPDSGRVALDGRITGLLEMGTGFNAELSGRENIFLNGQLVGMSRDEVAARYDDIVAFSELGAFIEHPLRTYSSGMVMRLAFSIATAADPVCFIVDEALAVGDAAFQQKCHKRMKEFREAGGSLILVSHSPGTLRMMCDRSILLHKGTVVEDAETEKVLNAYNFMLSRERDTEYRMVIEDKPDYSFGNFDAEITDVVVTGANSRGSVLASGEGMNILVRLRSNTDLPAVTIGISIRDRFGQVVFGTNTFLHDMPIPLAANGQYEVSFDMQANLGPGKYSVTAAIHTEVTHIEACFHWQENAGKFEVIGILGKRFEGIARLYPEIRIQEVTDAAKPQQLAWP